ncbi:MAG: hypothetical protein M3442_08490, partial [Chloroflexota bacterium]|nr:hypothetical protein [Chloroflexota bacterium]
MTQESAIAGPVAQSGAAGAVRTSAPSSALLPARGGRPRSLWSDAWRRLIRNRAAVAGMAVILLFWGIALFVPFIAPYGINDQHHDSTLRAPAWTSGDSRFLLGTDGVGRDELSRLLWGARISMVVGI